MWKLATWQHEENKKPNQEPDFDFQFQLAPGTAVRLEPSPSDLPRLINLPSWTQRDPLTLTKKTHHRDWPRQVYHSTVRSITRPTPGPWNSSIYLPFPNYPIKPDLKTITFSKHFYMNIKGLTWLHWRLNTLNFHKILQKKIYNEITLLLCSTEMTWQSILSFITSLPPFPSVLKYLSCRDNTSQMHFKNLPTLTWKLFEF